MTARTHGSATGGTRARNRPVRGAAAIAWLTVAALVPAALLNLALPGSGGPDSPPVAYVLFAAIVAAYGGVGALVVTRQPGNAVGWILWIVGTLIGLNIASTAYANWSLTAFGGTLPGTVLTGWISEWAFTPPLVIALLLLPLLFPDGRLPSRRWRWVLGFAIAATVLAGLPDMLRPGPLGPGGSPNPTAWTGDPAVLDLLTAFSKLSPVVAFPIVVAAAIVRYRRGSPIERQQLKWFGATVAFSVLALSVGVLTTDPIAIGAWVTAMVGLGLVPIAIGIAILRYRLYDIDRIISRTLGWTAVTLLLVVVFAGGVIGLEGVLAGVTQGQTLAVAGSTLAVFALFQPVRRRVQSAVDRRFDRARYDRELVLSAFSDRLRDQVDLGSLSGEVIDAARATVRPATAAVWLRQDPERSTPGIP